MKKEYEQEKTKKQFTAINENGKCCSFRLHADATVEDAKKYINVWNHFAGVKDRVVKVWENHK